MLERTAVQTTDSPRIPDAPPGLSHPFAHWAAVPAASRAGLAAPAWDVWARERAARAEARELRRRLHDATRRLAALRPLAELGEWVAFVAHEIRNPLGGIAATAEALAEPGESDDDDRAEGLAIILKEARRLQHTAQNLLDVARFPRSEPETVDPAAEAARAAEAVAPAAQAAGVEVTAEYPRARTLALADAGLLRHVFVNLATNAIQASPEGGTLTIRALEPDVGSAYVCVEFADAGCGIEPADRARIFEPFFTRRAGGTGLGLAVACRLVERAGGRITVESAPGEGACFTVWLPRADACDARS